MAIQLDGIELQAIESSMQHIVQRMRKKLKLPAIFTLDACRHGGMTEREEAELTDGQSRALSGHATQQSYESYPKRNMTRALSATRKRQAHRLANEAANEDATPVQNGQENSVQNDDREQRQIHEQTSGWGGSADRACLQADSLQTGNLAGNFAVYTRFVRFDFEQTTDIAMKTGKFPALRTGKINRDAGTLKGRSGIWLSPSVGRPLCADIVEKSFIAPGRNFLASLVSLTQSDIRDRIASGNIDHGSSRVGKSSVQLPMILNTGIGQIL